MKITELTERSKYAEPGPEATQFQRAQRLQQMKRAGVDVSKGGYNLGKGAFSGVDPEDLINVDAKTKQDALDRDVQVNRRKRDAELSKSRADQVKKDQENEREQNRKDKLQIKTAKQKEDEIQAQIKAINDKNHQDKIDQDKGYRKSADGRTLRDPRYYGKDDARGKPSSALRRGIDSLKADPYYAVSRYYNDKIDKVKTFLNQRMDSE